MNTTAPLLHAIVYKVSKTSVPQRFAFMLPVISHLICSVIGLATLGVADRALSLQWGNSGDEVADLQSRLAALNYLQTPVTGFYGDATTDAVMRFQADNKLLLDGIAERETLAVLREREKLSGLDSASPLIISPSFDFSFTNQNQAVGVQQNIERVQPKTIRGGTIITKFFDWAAGEG